MNAVDTYISQFDPTIQERLTEFRQSFFEVCPGCEESIRYNMPAYKVGKHHLYYAAYKKHIGFYPIYKFPEIEDHLSKYRALKTKDSVHFKHDKPLPIDLIKNVIRLQSELK